MAQTSSEVCSHWAQKWIEERFDEIQPLLQRYGFEARSPNPSQESLPPFISVEINDVTCYASVMDGEVQLDGAVFEELSVDYEEFQQALRKRCAAQINANRCQCQMCGD